MVHGPLVVGKPVWEANSAGALSTLYSVLLSASAVAFVAASFIPCRSHAEFFMLHGRDPVIGNVLQNYMLMARPKRFELLTPRFVVVCRSPN
jgi:hypothetical protein